MVVWVLVSVLVGGGVGACLTRWSRRRGETVRRDRSELEHAREHLQAGDLARARTAAAAIADRTPCARTRSAALTTLAWAALGEGYGTRANEALKRVEARFLDLYCFAAVRAAIGESETAIKALEGARAGDSLGPDGARLLVDLHARRGRMDDAVRAAVHCRHLLGVAGCRLVVNAACDAGSHHLAALLSSHLFAATGATEDAASWIRALSLAHEESALAGALDTVAGRLHAPRATLAQALADHRASHHLPG
jgi:hypothetical protein